MFVCKVYLEVVSMLNILMNMFAVTEIFMMVVGGKH